MSSEEFVSPIGSEAPGRFGEEAREELNRRFRHHAPNADKRGRHEAARDWVRLAANHLYDILPPGSEKDQTLIKLEEALFWANAAIARNDS